MSKNDNLDRGHRAETNPTDESAAFNVKDETTQSEQKEPVCGVVCNCEKLNVRKTPDASSKANIICEIAKAEKVVIDETESNDGWYKVYTKSGVEGFCMKEYIGIET